MAVSGNLGKKVPVIDDVLLHHEQEIYPTTSLKKNWIERVWFSNGSELLRWFETEVIGFETEIVKGRGYETYNSAEVKKEHKEEAKADEEAEQEQEALVPLVTHVNFIFAPNFFYWWSIYQPSAN